MTVVRGQDVAFEVFVVVNSKGVACGEIRSRNGMEWNFFVENSENFERSVYSRIDLRASTCEDKLERETMTLARAHADLTLPIVTRPAGGEQLMQHSVSHV